MRAFPILAVLLFSCTAALAVEPSDRGKQTDLGPVAAQQPAPAQDQQRDILNDIMTKMLMDEQTAPNPFQNPGPHLLSDAWAQRV